jgi:hypothetical protein
VAGEWHDGWWRDGIRRLFTNTLDWSAHPYFETIRGLEVSAHFVVRRDGEVLQFVSIDDRACAGRPLRLGRPRGGQRLVDRHRAGRARGRHLRVRAVRRAAATAAGDRPRSRDPARGRTRARGARTQDRSGPGLRLARARGAPALGCGAHPARGTAAGLTRVAREPRSMRVGATRCDARRAAMRVSIRASRNQAGWLRAASEKGRRAAVIRISSSQPSHYG